MKILVYEHHWLPRFFTWMGLNIIAITIFPVILLSGTVAGDEKVFKHEWVHIEQVRRDGWLSFYGSYPFKFIGNYCVKWDKDEAYWAIDVEAEAFIRQESDPMPNPDDYIINDPDPEPDDYIVIP